MAAPQEATDANPPPKHVAIIMDGNGRWAKARGLPRIAGHRKGADAVRRTVRAAGECGISYLTLFSFSSENWNRPEREVSDLMSLLRVYLRSEIAELHSNSVRLRVIGDRRRLPDDIAQLIANAESTTAANDRLTVILALSYGSRQEIVEAVRRIADATVAGEIAPDQITEATFAQFLFTADVPDPDLLIRTSGEQRISNFLLWQIAYTELVFTETLWPDFDAAQLELAIAEFQSRDRRYGAAVGPV